VAGSATPDTVVAASYDPGFTVSVFDLVTPFAVALIAAFVESGTETVVTVNGADVIPNGTVTVGVAGDAIAGLLDDSVTTMSPGPAAHSSVAALETAIDHRSQTWQRKWVHSESDAQADVVDVRDALTQPGRWRISRLSSVLSAKNVKQVARPNRTRLQGGEHAIGAPESSADSD
jgi:hypothetical protein